MALNPSARVHQQNHEALHVAVEIGMRPHLLPPVSQDYRVSSFITYFPQFFSQFGRIMICSAGKASSATRLFGFACANARSTPV